MTTPTLLSTIPQEQLPAHVISTGEALPAALAARLTADRTIHNLYGPAEFTLYGLTATIGPEAPADRPIPLGHANHGVAAYVLDHRLRPVPPSTIGEIYLAGPQEALGYLDDCAGTATAFVACPWWPGHRMYRTGDLGRIDATTGEIHYHGRNDDQLSMHGVRVEPGEIERVAAGLDNIVDAVAVANEITSGHVIDLAFTLTAGADRTSAPTAVRRHLIEHLPPAMWPRRIVVVDDFPMGDTGKLDRKTIAAQIAEYADNVDDYVAPQTTAEHAVAAAVTAVTGVDEPSMSSTLIELGATSIGLIEIAAQLGSSLGVQLRLGDVTPASTLAELADVVNHAHPTASDPEPAGPRRLTRRQREIWLLNQLSPTSPVYHLPVRLTLADGIDSDIVRAALTDVALRHDALRTVIRADENGEPEARLLTNTELQQALPITVGPLDDAGLRQAVTAPFGLATAPPWRAVLETTPDAVTLALVGHHVAVDGWSMPILVHDFGTALRTRLDGHSPSWAGNPTVPSRSEPSDTDMRAAEEYWATRLDGAPEHLMLPEPRSTPPSGPTAGPATVLSRTLDADVLAAGTARAAQAGATLHSLLSVALAATLAQITGNDDVVVAIPIAGRATTDDLTQVGMFVDMVPLRTVGVLELGVDDAFVDAGTQLAEAIPHAAAAPAALPDVILAHESERPPALDSDIITSAEQVRTGEARTALEFTVAHTADDGLEITLTVADQRVDLDGAEEILRLFSDTVGGLAAAAVGTVVEDCLPGVEVVAAQQARRTVPIDPIDALRRHVHELPMAAAVLDGSTVLTYAELVARAEELTCRLAECGVRAGERVAVRMGRSADTVVALVAVLMADCAYVPIDPGYPQSRIDAFLADVGPVAVISDDLDVTSYPHLAGRPRDAGLAYVIHTSGSTGMPKGVKVTRANLAAMLGAALDEVGAERTDVWSWAHSYAFDFSVWEIFGALASGGSVAVIGRDTVRDPVAFTEALDAYGVTILSQTPTSFARLTDVRDALTALRCVVFGGEALDPTSLRPWAQAHQTVRLINMYGITETTVHLIATNVDTTDVRSIIGRPLDGVRGVVLDGRLRPVPLGGRGELYVSGDQVSDGYLNQPGLTATRFVADPYRMGSRLYRTGDLVRRLPDGQLSYLGRSDDQIQLRGHRIDLGEIATVLRGCDGVTDARALSAPGATVGDDALVAFVILDDSAVLGEAELTTFCATHLPPHMVPARIGVVSAWPMTDTGKLDRAALLGSLGSASGVRPLSVGEEIVTAAMRAVIGDGPLDVIGPHTSFFAAGGNSLSAARLAARLSAGERRVTVADVFEYPTVEGLARVLAAEAPNDALPSLLASAVLPERLPLTPEQEDLWLRWRADPSFTGYLMPVAIPLPGVDAGRVRDVAEEILRRYAVLRTSYPEVDGVPYQRVHDVDSVPSLTAPTSSPTAPDLSLTAPSLALTEPSSAVTEPSSGVSAPVVSTTPARLAPRGLLNQQGELPLARTAPDGLLNQQGELPLARTAPDGLFNQRGELPPQGSAPDGILNQRGELPRQGSAPDGILNHRGELAALCRPIDLTAALPWRARLVEHDGTLWLLAAIHHIAVDGESLDILAAEFQRLLHADDDTDTDASDRIDYPDYTLWRHEVLAHRRPELTAYWSSVFTTSPNPLRLPEVNLAAAQRSSGTAYSESAELTEAETDALDALAVACRTTPYIVLHSVIAAVLARTSGTDTVTVGAAVTGRLDDRLATVPGLMARTVPLHTHIDLDLPFRDLLTAVTATDLAAIAHADLPLSDIAALADPTRTGIGHTLFDVMFASVDPPLDGIPEPLPLFGIDIQEFRGDGRQHLTMSGRTDVATRSVLAALLERILTTLRGVLTSPDAPTITHLTPSVPTLSSPELATETLADLLVGHNDSATAIVDAAHRLRGRGDAITNAELDRLATTLARRLIAAGVGPGDVVALHLPRSVHSVIATIAVARAGAAFVHVEPTDPIARRQLILDRSHARCVLSVSQYGLPQKDLDVLLLDDLAAADALPFDPAERRRPVHPDDLAYLTFTSGTTGTPKAVEITHRGLAGWARATAARLGLTTSDRVLHTYATTFDAHLMGIVPVRVAGATIVICPPDVVGADQLQRTLDDHDVDVLMTTPSILATLDPGKPTRLRHVVVGGEALTLTMVRDWPIAITNEYGPTETTVAATSATLGPGEPADLITIGTPLPGIDALVLDDTLRPVPDLTVGELYLTGNGLARGYLDDPGRTATGFVACPWQPGYRMYRTGDLVHRRTDGTLVIHGRRDHQLKLRGIRIEPGEINGALTALPWIAEADTTIRTTAAGEQVLVSRVVPQNGHTLDADDVRHEVAKLLPRSLVPAVITTGDTEVLVPRDGAVVNPRTPMEELVAQTCADVLDLSGDTIAADADIFALGATSLSASQIAARLSAATDRDLPLRTVFDARTVAQIAACLETTAPATTRIAPTHLPVPAYLPLSLAQQRMWIHHRLHPESSAYHLPVVVRLRGSLDVPRLSHALARLVATHATLRTIYPDTATGPEQHILPPATSPRWSSSPRGTSERIETTAAPRWSSSPRGTSERIETTLRTSTISPNHLLEAITNEVQRPFDLATEPAIRTRLFISDTDPDDSVLSVVMHHIAVDGWSTRILLDDLLRAYAGEEPAARTDLTYADFTQWQRDVLGDPADPTSRYAVEIDYWTDILDGAAPVELAAFGDARKAASPKVPQAPGRITHTVDADLVAQVTQAAATRSATFFHAVHAALAATLNQITGQTDIVIGAPVRGRPDPAWDDVVGMFVNTVALRADIGSSTSILDAISHSRDVLLAADAHSLVPYDDVVRELFPGTRPGAAEDPLISVLLVHQDVLPDLGDQIEIGGEGTIRAEVVGSAADAVAAKYDIEVVLARVGEGMSVTVVHSERVDAAVAGVVLETLVTYLEAAGGASAQAFPQLGDVAAGSGLDTLARSSRATRPAGGDGSGLDTLARSSRATRPAGGARGGAAAGDDGSGLDTLARSSRATRPAGGAGGDDPTAGRVARASAASASVSRPLPQPLIEEVRTAFAGILNLHTDAVTAATDFFTLGGTSLSAARVVSALSAVTGRQVPAHLLFEHPSPAELAAAIADLSAPITLPALQDFPDTTDDLPLAPTQQRLWARAAMLPDDATYTLPMIIPTLGQAILAVESAITGLVAAQPVLRTRYIDTEIGPRQHVVDADPEIVHLSADMLSPTVMHRILAQPFDLAAAPPVRFTIITDGDHPVAVVMIAHHIAVDGESIVLLRRDLMRRIDGQAPDESSSPGFARVARWLSAAVEARRQADLAYWLETLDGYSGVLDLAADRPALDHLTAARHRIVFSDDIVDRIDVTTRAQYVTDFHLVHAAIVLALAAQAGTDDVVVATPMSMRRDPQLADVVGMLVATVAPRITITPTMTVSDLLATVRSTDLAAQDHSLLPFDELIAALELPHNLERAPLAQVLLSVDAEPALDGDLTYLDAELPPQPVEYDLQIAAARIDGRWVIDLDYAVELFDAASIAHLRHRIEAAVAAVTDDPTRLLRDVSLVDADELDQLTDFAASGGPQRPPTLSEIFDDTVSRHADRVAIDDGHRQITYRNLDTWVTATANQLHRSGFGRGSVIALMIPRSAEWVVAVWAVARIGATAVMVDTTYPQARIDRILTRTGAAVITADDIPPVPAEPVAAQYSAQVHPEEVAYIISTSGTTGTPNAVEVTHAGLHRLLAADGGAPRRSGRVALTASPGFDTILGELLAPLPSGATLVPVPSGIVAGDELTEWLAAAEITVLESTPSVLATLDPMRLPELEAVVVGGEALPQDLADRWAQHVALYNAYGPTEATVEVTFDRHCEGEHVRIGPLLDGVGGWVLDRWLRPVPPGVVGELYVSGTALARGYRDDPALTARRFVAAPDGQRMYRTGDLVRLVDGALRYLGRIDQQVQIRGQRVEIDEIDTVLRHAGAVHAATVAQSTPAGDVLVSYVVSGERDPATLADLKEVCSRQLPRHMVPTRIVVVEELPLTASGKLDVRALPAVDWSSSRREPSTETETAVLAAFREVLGVEIGMDDDFFDAGGNSLALIGLQRTVEQRTGVRVPAAALLLNPSPSAVAAHVVDGSSSAWPVEHLVDLSADSSADRPVLWCIHPASGLAVDYQPLAVELSDIRVMGVQVAQIDSLDHVSLASVAAQHLAAIRAAQESGPYHLAGWSAGGVIAQEVARQLVDAGEQVASLVLLDARTPAEIVELGGGGSDVDEVIGQALADGAIPHEARPVVEEYRRVVDAVLTSIDRHEPGEVSVDRVIVFAADDNPDPHAWREYVRGEWHTVGVAARHVDFGQPEVMARIGRELGELW